MLRDGAGQSSLNAYTSPLFFSGSSPHLDVAHPTQSGVQGVGLRPRDLALEAIPCKHSGSPILNLSVRTRPNMFKKLMFPRPKRNFPLQRWVRIFVRTWHLMAMGYLLGSTAMGVPLGENNLPLLHTFFSGAVFSALEVYASGVWFLQLKGQAVLVKMVLLGGALLTSADPMPWLWAAVILGGVSSHMPGRYRYYSVFHGREMKE